MDLPRAQLLAAGTVSLVGRERKCDTRNSTHRRVRAFMWRGTDLRHTAWLKNTLVGIDTACWLSLRGVGHRRRCAIQVVQTSRLTYQATKNCANCHPA